MNSLILTFPKHITTCDKNYNNVSNIFLIQHIIPKFFTTLEINGSVSASSKNTHFCSPVAQVCTYVTILINFLVSSVSLSGQCHCPMTLAIST